MSRAWINAAAGLGAVIGGTLGWAVTTVGCRPDTCFVSAGIVALIAGAIAGAGVGIVMILVARSLEEWREAERAGQQPPGPGCETPQD